MGTCARPAEAAEWDAMLHVILAANPHLHARIERFRAAAAPWHDATPIVCCEGGEIRSVAVIFRRRIWTTSGYMRLGGIGAVATHPAFRNRGLAAAAIAACEERLRLEGYPVAVLFCSITPFYQRLGWRIVSDEGPPLPPQNHSDPGLSVRMLDLSREWPLLAEVYEHAASGAIERTAELWREYSTWPREDPALAWGAFDSGKLVAYARGRRGTGLEVLEVTALPEYERALGSLVHRQAATAGAIPGPPVGTHMMMKSLRVPNVPQADSLLTFPGAGQDTPWSPRVWWPIDRF